MANRLDLQTIFENILGSRNVYFQPPASVKLKYPAIVYSRNDVDSLFADNGTYRNVPRYDVTLIDKNPDSLFIEKILALPYCSYDRSYTADNLNHDVFIIYY